MMEDQKIVMSECKSEGRHSSVEAVDSEQSSQSWETLDSGVDEMEGSSALNCEDSDNSEPESRLDETRSHKTGDDVTSECRACGEDDELHERKSMLKKEVEELDPTGKENGSSGSEHIKDVLQYKQKAKKIHEALRSDPVDIETLKEAAISEGGLLNDGFRKEVWPLLLDINPSDVESGPQLKDLQDHKDYSQVVLDVNRSLKRFPPGIGDDLRFVLQDQLTRLIIRVLQAHDELHYYQGYHDIAITFLLVVGEDVGFKIVEKLSLTHLREFMEPTMEKTTHLLNYIYPIMKRVKPQLHDFLEESEIGTIFCLPWLITWYGHTLNNYRDVVRLYDYFLAMPLLMPMYLAAAIVLHREKEILEGECDMSYQHALLSRVPDHLPFEKLLDSARQLYDKFPPKTLEKEVEARSQRDLVLFRRPAHNLNVRWQGVAKWLPYLPRPFIIWHAVKVWKWPLLATLLAGTVAYMTRTQGNGTFQMLYR